MCLTRHSLQKGVQESDVLGADAAVDAWSVYDRSHLGQWFALFSFIFLFSLNSKTKTKNCLDSCASSEIEATLSCIATTIDVSVCLGAHTKGIERTRSFLSSFLWSLCAESSLWRCFLFPKGGESNGYRYELRCTLAYYGQHYVAFARNPSTRLWTVFDDSTGSLLSVIECLLILW